LYADGEEYVMAASFMDEIEMIARITGWSDEQKSSWLIGSLQVIGFEFTETLIQYQIN
jgi:hypothetical protein